MPDTVDVPPRRSVSGRRGVVTSEGEGMSAGRLVLIGVCALAACGDPARTAAQLVSAPLVVIETERGAFVFQTFPGEAPRTVEHVTALVRQGFYDGLRVHRAAAGFVAQFGDPQTRDLSKRDLWGRGIDASSGSAVGVSEISKRRRHVTGAVGIAHMGDPAKADSQIYITLSARPDLDGQYTVFGQVVEGEDVPATLRVGDLITRAYVRE